MSTPIVVEGLTKRFGSFEAVKEVSFAAQEGQSRPSWSQRLRQEHGPGMIAGLEYPPRAGSASATSTRRSIRCRSVVSASCSSTTLFSGT